MMTKLRRAAALLATGVVLLAGCSEQPANSPRTDESGGAGAPAVVVGPEGAPLAEEWTVLSDDTPLGEYRKYMYGPSYDFEESLGAAIKANDERQEVVTSCMKRAGFDYYPTPYGGSRELESESGWNVRAKRLMVPVLDSDRARVAQWGYGVDPESWDEVMFAGQDPEFEKVVARNDAYFESLSASGQELYLTALSGPADPATGYRDSGQGCASDAFEEVPEVPAASRANDAFDVAHDGILYELVQVTKWYVGLDPRAVALDEEWAACAAGKGLDFAGTAWADPDSEPTVDVSMLNRISPVSALNHARNMGEDGEWSIDAGYLRAYPAQVEVALVDYDCRQQLDYMDRIMEIVLDVEQDFLDKNRVALEAMKADALREP
ncbi:MAG: hypothetical protein LBJ02_03915 [Bifidobacteriaceae bacterium]|nr:hypothetical protein [Bifidobacteriaceae bacterium]